MSAKPTSLQAYKPTSLQAYKPCKPLIALLAALALCLFAGCSSEDDTPAYCGKWTPTDNLISYLKTELQNSGGTLAAAAASLSTSSISLTINSNNTISLSVNLGSAYSLSISGTYTYSGTDSAGTFYFTLDYGALETYASPIGSAFAVSTDDNINDAPAVAYTTGKLSVVLDEEESESDETSTVIFTK